MANSSKDTLGCPSGEPAAAPSPSVALAGLKTEIRRVNPRDVVLLEKNARYMTGPQMKRLVENIQRDGALTSVPLCVLLEDEKLRVISGNHRVMGSIQAGLAEIDVMVILTPIDHKRLVAIQLAHNQITGQDDPSILQSLYDSLDLDHKLYSGLTDDNFKGLAQLDIGGLSIGSVKYEDLQFTFLPEDKAVFTEVLRKIEKKGVAKRVCYVAHLADFNRLFETLIAVKHHTNVHNGATALKLMADLAAERLEQLEAEAQANGGQANGSP